MKLFVVFLVCAVIAIGLGLALFVFAALTSAAFHVAFIASAISAVLALVGLLARRASESFGSPGDRASTPAERALPPTQSDRISAER